jgi:hypothetical protein
VSAPKFDFKAFDARLASLGILSAELGQIIGRSAATVDRWREGRATPDSESLVLLRPLADDTDALRRVNQLRRTHTRTLEGDGVRYAGIENVPYGTSDIGKVTGGVGA